MSDGTGYALFYPREKNIEMSLEYEDIYGNQIASELQLIQGFADFKYDVSIYTTGATIYETGIFVSGIATNQSSLVFKFTKEQNLAAFGTGSGAQRYYQLLFDVKNNDGQNDVLATYYHIPANIDNIRVFDYNTDNTLSGLVTFNFLFAENFDFFIPRQVDIYTGANSGNAYDLNGFSFLSNNVFTSENATQSITLTEKEIPVNTNIYYKFIPYDDFGTGIMFGGVVSGYLYSPQQPVSYGQGIPPLVNIFERTGLYFSGLNTNSNTTGDGALLFETGADYQTLYFLKSGKWKTIVPFEETSGLYSRFVNPPTLATGSGRIGDFSISGRYLYAATGNNQWGRTLLNSWYGPIGAFSFSGSGLSGTGFISWTAADQATGYGVYRSDDNVTFTQIFNGSSLSYDDPVPSPHPYNYYYYIVSAFNDEYAISGSPITVNVPP